MSYSIWELFADLVPENYDLDQFVENIKNSNREDKVASMLNIFIKAYAESQEVSYLNALGQLADHESFEDTPETLIIRKTVQHGLEIIGDMPAQWELRSRRSSHGEEED